METPRKNLATPPKFKISVVTPCFNSAGTIRETVESVQSQSYQDWEHLVMDGGSSDGTVEVLKSYPRLIWESEKDEGHYHAMNKGVAKASGDVIVILNADDCFRPGALEAVAHKFAGQPELDALFGDVIFVDDAKHRIYQRQEALYDYRVLLFGLDYICHQTLFVRKSVYEKIGGYRHKDFRNSADYEFKLRLGRTGCRVGHVRRFLVDYRYHPQGQSADRRIIRNMRKETASIRAEYGNAGGFKGSVLSKVYKAKRQFEKLFLLGKMDLVPGTWHLRSHLREKSTFSSNAGLDKL